MPDLVAQFVDTADGILADAADPTGANNPGSCPTFVIDDEFRIDSPQYDVDTANVAVGAVATAASWRPAEIAFRLAAGPTATYDQLTQFVAALNAILVRGGIFKWQPPDAAEPVWFDFLPSKPVSLYRGEKRGLFRTFSFNRDPNGLPVVLLRQPYTRSSPLVSTTNLLPYGWFLDLDDSGVPDGWVTTGTGGMSPADEAYQVSLDAGEVVQQDSPYYTPVTAGLTYTLSASAEKIGGTGRIRFGVVWQDSSGTLISTATGGWHTVTDLARISSSFAAPALAARGLMFVEAEATSVWLLSLPQFEEGSEASAPVSGTQTMLETLTSRVAAVYVDSDLPVPAKVTIRAVDGEEVQQYHLSVLPSEGVVGQRRVMTWANALKAQDLAAGTLYNGATLSGGDVKVLLEDTPGAATGITTQHRRFVRLHLSDVDLLEAIRGGWDLWLRVKHQGHARIHYSLRWGPSLLDPPLEGNAEYRLDTAAGGEQIDTFGYSLIPLGRIYVPEQAPLEGVTLEIHMHWSHDDPDWAPDTAEYTLLDHLLFSPAVHVLGAPALSGTTGAPYALLESNFGYEHVYGGAFENPDPSDTSVVLADNGDDAVLTRVLQPGRYRVVFRYTTRGIPAYIPGTGAGTGGFFFYISGGAGVLPTTQERWGLPADDITDDVVIMEFEITAANTTVAFGAEGQVVGDSGPIGGTLTLHETSLSFLSPAGLLEPVITNPADYSVERRTAAGALRARWQVSGPTPVWLLKGWNGIMFRVGHPKPDPRYPELDDRTDGEYEVGIEYSPRRLG